MDVALWIAQGLVASIVAIAGAVKLFVPKERLERRMHWATSWPAGRIKLLGAAELAGAVGVVVPAATGIAPILTPVAAVCIAILMAGAVHAHVKLRESFVPPIAVGIVCMAIAVGRFRGLVG